MRLGPNGMNEYRMIKVYNVNNVVYKAQVEI